MSAILFSLIIAAVIWNISKGYYDGLASDMFESNAVADIEKIERHMSLYENALRSGIGLFQGSNEVTRQEWHNFVKAIEIKKNYPGVRGIGFSIMLHPDEVPKIEEEMRINGFPSFTIYPSGIREQYSAILYLEPMDERNLKAIGYDMFSEQTRREAMETSRDTGLPSVSGRVTLVQEIDSKKQPGMLMYLPLYKKDAKIETLQNRRESLVGFVYAPFRMNDFMGEIGLKIPLLDFEIYDSEITSENHLLYRSFESPLHISKYRTTKILRVNNRTWNINISSTEEFDASVKNNLYPLLITLAGLIANLVLSYIIFMLIKSRQKIQAQSKINQEQASIIFHQARLAQIGKILSMIAHQWRQPLNVISVKTGTLALNVEMDNCDSKLFQELLNSMNKDIQNLSLTIDNFSKFFKDSEEKQLVVLKNIIDETLQIINSSITYEGIELIYEFEDDITISTYVNQVKHVVLNILKNSEEAFSKKERSDDAKIWIAIYIEGESAYVTIEDNAGGIPEELITNIFDPYFSTKEGLNGNGLGLYMSKMIIEKHCKGKLSVINTSHGTKLIIEFPLVKK